MSLAELSALQIVAGISAALIIGMSKTGVPGLGMLSIPLTAYVFGGRLSLGALLPMLIVADSCAVAWYRQHTRWDHLIKIGGWVLLGIVLGSFGLWLLAAEGLQRDWMSFTIGVMILLMVTVTLLKKRLGDRFSPTSNTGVAVTGTSAGFATAVSNAAGPITSIYLTAARLPKEEFIGTSAWFYFGFNLIKIPFFVALSFLKPDAPLVSNSTLLFDLAMVLPVLLGAYIGRRFLSSIPQSKFDALVLILAVIGAANLMMKL